MEPRSPEDQPITTAFPLSAESVNKSLENISKNPEQSFRQDLLHLTEFQPDLNHIIDEIGDAFGIRSDLRTTHYMEGAVLMYRVLRDQAQLRGVELPEIDRGVRRKLFSSYIDAVTEKGTIFDLTEILEGQVKERDMEVARVLEETSKFRPQKSLYKFGALSVYNAFKIQSNV